MKTKKTFSQASRCPGRDLNRASPEYKSRALPLGHPVYSCRSETADNNFFLEKLNLHHLVCNFQFYKFNTCFIIVMKLVVPHREFHQLNCSGLLHKNRFTMLQNLFKWLNKFLFKRPIYYFYTSKSVPFVCLLLFYAEYFGRQAGFKRHYLKFFQLT
jgi:hypothetical protein